MASLKAAIVSNTAIISKIILLNTLVQYLSSFDMFSPNIKLLKCKILFFMSCVLQHSNFKL